MKSDIFPNDSYSKKELIIDAGTFTAASSCFGALNNAIFLSPATAGLVAFGAANTGAIQASKAFCNSLGIESNLIRVALLISSVAATTLALPWLFAALSIQSLAALSVETALQGALLHLGTKVGSYAVYRTGLSLKNIELPSSVQNVREMSTGQLQTVRDHLIDFPSAGNALSLPIHQQLHARLKDESLGTLPLTHFGELGELTAHDLKILHEMETGKLPIEKRAQLNELFLAHGFPPQERPYEAGELPNLDMATAAKISSHADVCWAHLILRLNSQTEIHPDLPRLFFKTQLPPARNEWLPLTAPVSKAAVEDLPDFELAWYHNYYQTHTSEWNELPEKIRFSLEARFPKRTSHQTHTAPPLVGRASKDFPWKYAILGALIGIGGIAAYYSIRNPLPIIQRPPSPDLNLPDETLASPLLNQGVCTVPSPLDVGATYSPAIELVKTTPVLQNREICPIPSPFDLNLPEHTSNVDVSQYLPNKAVEVVHTNSTLPTPFSKGSIDPQAFFQNVTPPVSLPVDQPRWGFTPFNLTQPISQVAHRNLTLGAMPPKAHETLTPLAGSSGAIERVTSAANPVLMLMPPKESTDPVESASYSMFSFLAAAGATTIISALAMQCLQSYSVYLFERAFMEQDHGVNLQPQLPDPGPLVLYRQGSSEPKPIIPSFNPNPYADLRFVPPSYRISRGGGQERSLYELLINKLPIRPASPSQDLLLAPQASRGELSVVRSAGIPEVSSSDVRALAQPGSQWVKISSNSENVFINFGHPDAKQNPLKTISDLSNLLQGWNDRLIQIEIPQGVFELNRNDVLHQLGKISTALTFRNSPPSRSLEHSKPRRRLNKPLFLSYCKKHHVAANHQTAWDDAKEGVSLFQQIRQGRYVVGTPDNIRKICWGMMAHTIAQGKGFENGTFVVDDPGFRLFKTFTNCSDIYGRASSHFKKRAIPTTDGYWEGYSHFGIDIPNLPPNMQAVLIGMIQTKDGRERIYIKCEDWGADLRLLSAEKAKHFFFHSLDFFASQYKRWNGTNQADGDRKEHMNPEDIETIQKLIAPYRNQVNLPLPNLKEWGFIEAVPYLIEILKLRDIDTSHKEAIKKYLDYLDERYGEVLLQQKGNEVQLGQSMMEYDSKSLTRSVILDPKVQEEEIFIGPSSSANANEIDFGDNRWTLLTVVQ